MYSNVYEVTSCYTLHGRSNLAYHWRQTKRTYPMPAHCPVGDMAVIESAVELCERYRVSFIPRIPRHQRVFVRARVYDELRIKYTRAHNCVTTGRV